MANARHAHHHEDHPPHTSTPRALEAHTHAPVDCCSHHDVNIERYLGFYMIGGVLALVSLIADQAGITNPLVAALPAALAAILLGSHLFLAAIREILDKRVSSSSLAALAILAAMAVGNY